MKKSYRSLHDTSVGFQELIRDVSARAQNLDFTFESVETVSQFLDCMKLKFDECRKFSTLEVAMLIGIARGGFYHVCKVEEDFV